MPALLPVDPVQTQLDVLRAELADLAYDLELRGRRDAADVAMMLRARLQEIAAGGERETPADNSRVISLSLPS